MCDVSTAGALASTSRLACGRIGHVVGLAAPKISAHIVHLDGRMILHVLPLRKEMKMEKCTRSLGSGSV